MKKLIALGLLVTSCMFAADPTEPELIPDVCQVEPVKASYRYFCVGLGPLPLPAPLIGVGGRFQKGHHGFDGSLQLSSILLINMAKINMNYLYYCNPNLDSQFYLGAGLGLLGFFSIAGNDKNIAPQLVIGKQYTNKKGASRHFQGEIFPLFEEGGFPLVVLSYGLSF